MSRPFPRFPLDVWIRFPGGSAFHSSFVRNHGSRHPPSRRSPEPKTVRRAACCGPLRWHFTRAGRSQSLAPSPLPALAKPRSGRSARDATFGGPHRRLGFGGGVGRRTGGWVGVAQMPCQQAVKMPTNSVEVVVVILRLCAANRPPARRTCGCRATLAHELTFPRQPARPEVARGGQLV